MLRITDTGIIIDQLADVHQRLTEGFRRIYGEDINLDSDTPDGQMIGLFSQEIANINQAIAMIIQMLDPYKSTGAWLEQRSMYAGIIRRGADYSYIYDVVFTGRPNIAVPAGSVLIDSNRVKWLTLTAVNLDVNGSARADIRSAELGGYTLPGDSELTMETVTVGVDKITTTTAAAPGVFEETDGSLLQRFMRSHSINNHDDRAGLEGALLDVADVRQARVYENYTSQTDVNGVPGHTLNAVVMGGSDADIALTILKKKLGGCGLMGDTVHCLDYEGLPRTVAFDRAENVDINVSLVLERTSGFSDIDTDGIKTALAATEFTIGESVYAMRLTCQVNSVQGFYIKSIRVNGAEVVRTGARQCARIMPENVEVLIE